MNSIKLITYALFILFLQFVFVFEAHSQTSKTSNVVDYCDLFKSAAYSGKLIEISAVLYIAPKNAETWYFYSTKCNNGDFFAMTNFSEAKNSAQIKTIQKKTESKNLPTLYLVVAIGKFTDFLIPSGPYGLFSAEFIVNEIKSIKPIKSQYDLPDTKSPSPLSETGNALMTFNSEFMASFLGRGFVNYELESIITDNSKISINNKIVVKEDFIKLALDRKDGAFEVKIEKVTKNNDEWGVQGIVTYIGNMTEKITFDNTYLRQDNNSWKSWKLISAKINNEMVK